MNRKLDGYYFRVQRDDKWTNTCLSDATEEERADHLKTKEKDYLIDVVCHLAGCLRALGDHFDIVATGDDDDIQEIGDADE